MSFRLAAPDAIWPCRVAVPVPAENGGVADRWYTAFFEAVTVSQLEELSAKGDSALIRRVLRGWQGVEAADGARLAFTAGNVGLLLDVLAWRYATARAYVAWLQGHPEKNSEAPPVIS